jgi:chromosome segregation ATPase
MSVSHEELLQELAPILARLFDWSDTSYVHAILHVENAVSNLQCDLKVEQAEVKRLKTRLKTMEDHAIAQSRVVDKANAEAVVQYNHWGDALRKIDQLNNELAAQRGLAKSLLGERDIAMENRLRQDEEIDQLKKQLTEAQDENMRIALRRSS